MPVVFYPDPKYLSTPIIAQRVQGHWLSRDYSIIPVIDWLINNVGEVAAQSDSSWPHGNGWEMGYAYAGSGGADWESWHFIVIHQQGIDEKLLTEFALRFV